MRSTPTRKVTGALSGLLLAAALVLTGCASGQVSQTADQVSGVDGGSGNAGVIGVRNVLLATPDQGSYPAGANVPVLLWVTNTGLQADTLASASTAAAGSVAIAGTATVQGQSRLEIGAATPVKVTLTGLTNALSFGTSVPITFSFKSAGDVTVNVPIEIPAERTNNDRDTIDIHPTQEPNLWQSGFQAEPPTAGGGTVSPTPAQPVASPSVEPSPTSGG